MNPMLIGGLLNLAGATPGLINAIQQGKERKRLLAEGPEGLNQFEQARLGGAQQRAANSQVAGYGQELENINQQQANILGEAKRAGVSSSNMLNTLSRLNQQGQAARRNLAIRGAQGQRAAQSELGGIQGQVGQILENRKRYFENNLANLDTARKQQIGQFAMAPFQGAMAGMRYSNPSTLKTPTAESVRFNPETDMQISTEDSGDAMFGSNMRTGVNPTPEMTGLGGQFNMKQDIGYDPYKDPLRNYPNTKRMYDNMFDPNAAARRMNMRSQMLRTSPYYEF